MRRHFLERLGVMLPWILYLKHVRVIVLVNFLPLYYEESILFVESNRFFKCKSKFLAALEFFFEIYLMYIVHSTLC
jgi:hypothetical protein